MEVIRHNDIGAHGVGHPFGYDPEEDLLVIGGPSTYHGQTPDMPWGFGSEQGRVGPDHLAFYDMHGVLDDQTKRRIWEELKKEHLADPFVEEPGEMSWDAAPSHVEVEKNWFNTDPTTQNKDDSEWKFAARNPYKVPHVISLHDDQAKLFDMAPEEKLPKVVHIPTGDTEHGMGHAFFYYPRKDEIHIGDAGSYHRDIDSDYVAIAGNPLALAGRVDPNNLAFYHHGNKKWEPHYDKIRKALKQWNIEHAEGDNAWDNLYTLNPNSEKELIPEVDMEQGWNFASVREASQNGSQKLSAPSKVFVDDRGIPLTENENRKFIYTPWDQTVTFNAPDEVFHGQIYKNKYGSPMGVNDIGRTVYTGRTYDGGAAQWYQHHPDMHLINQSMGMDSDSGWNFG